MTKRVSQRAIRRIFPMKIEEIDEIVSPCRGMPLRVTLRSGRKMTMQPGTFLFTALHLVVGTPIKKGSRICKNRQTYPLDEIERLDLLQPNESVSKRG